MNWFPMWCSEHVSTRVWSIYHPRWTGRPGTPPPPPLLLSPHAPTVPPTPRGIGCDPTLHLVIPALLALVEAAFSAVNIQSDPRPPGRITRERDGHPSRAHPRGHGISFYCPSESPLSGADNWNCHCLKRPISSSLQRARGLSDLCTT